jgi:hypothetical protein
MEGLALHKKPQIKKPMKIFLTAAIVLVFGVASLAKTSKLTGKIVGYDLLKHTSKSANLQQNEEVVVLETNSTKKKGKYVKVVFSSSGTSQIEPQYFDGTQPLSADVLREHTCDENSPRFVREISLQQMGGTYLLTDAYKTSPPAKIKTLECYVVIYKKKK